MADPLDMPNMRERYDRVKAQMGHGGGGPTGGDEFETRLSALEKGVDQINAKLETMIGKVDELRVGFARFDERLKNTASSSELSDVKGRVASLPTTWQMITLVIGTVGTILGGAFLILKFGLPHTP